MTTYSITALNDPLGTNASGQAINASGEVIGEYVDKSNVQHGFLYDAGKYTTIDDPLATPGTSFTTGINAAGQIVGFYTRPFGQGAVGGVLGFLYSNGN